MKQSVSNFSIARFAKDIQLPENFFHFAKLEKYAVKLPPSFQFRLEFY